MHTLADISVLSAAGQAGGKASISDSNCTRERYWQVAVVRLMCLCASMGDVTVRAAAV